MIITMILIFVLGYLCIALEHKLRIDKAAIALLMCGALWTVLSLLGNDAQIGTQLIEQLGDTSEILFFLIGAMTIVELIDRHGGFHVITDHIKTRNKRKLLWLLSIITFFMSAVLDNMTTTIIMIMLLRRMISGQKERWIFASVIVIAANSGGAFSPIGDVTIVELIDRHGGFHVITDHIKTRNKRKLLWLLSIITFFMSAVLDNMTTTIIMIMLLRRMISGQKERWIFASVIVIAANSGGAFSPIGDVTTIMLWMRGNVTSGLLVAKLFLPALVSVIIPTAIACRYIPDENAHPEKLDTAPKLPPFVGPRFSHFVLVLGVGGLLFVPIFKAVTGLPPYLGMLISLGVLWVFTELVYDHKQNMEESIKNRVSKVLKHIDMPTILFFLGILMSVAALQSAGLLTDFADFLDKNVHEVYTIAGITGLLSAVIDNVPLVAACMGMYPVVDTAALASSLDPVYMQAFVQDGIFWHLLTFCAGVGGSLLIIGSAAGVVAMGLEKIEFGWYLRKITLLALAGYFAGMLVIFLEHLLLG